MKIGFFDSILSCTSKCIRIIPTMINKKIIFSFFILFALNGCVQSTAMLGPGITLATTGNIPQAGLSFVTNKAVEQETGMNTYAYVFIPVSCSTALFVTKDRPAWGIFPVVAKVIPGPNIAVDWTHPFRANNIKKLKIIFLLIIVGMILIHLDVQLKIESKKPIFMNKLN